MAGHVVSLPVHLQHWVFSARRQVLSICTHWLPDHGTSLIMSTTARLARVSHLKSQNILILDLECISETPTNMGDQSCEEGHAQIPFILASRCSLQGIWISRLAPKARSRKQLFSLKIHSYCVGMKWK